MIIDHQIPKKSKFEILNNLNYKYVDIYFLILYVLLWTNHFKIAENPEINLI